MANINLFITLGGLFAGLAVGLTGMGGAAIVTPMLIFVFGIPAPVTVSTDIVSAAFMKPVGAAIHIKQRTPHRRVVFWLCAGSVPGVIIGTVIFSQIALVSGSDKKLRVLIGVALIISVLTSIWKTRMHKFEGRADRVFLNRRRRILILCVGLVVGILVGLTSVGSGTLIAASLIIMFPSMLPSRLVGTDLVQAVPMLIVGGLAHWGLGEIDLGVLISLLIGMLPGVWIGARVSSRYDGQALRLLLLVLVGAGGLSLVGIPPLLVGAVTLVGTLIIGTPIVIQTLRHGTDDSTAEDRPPPPFSQSDH